MEFLAPFGLHSLKVYNEAGTLSRSLGASSILRFSESVASTVFTLNGVAVGAKSKSSHATWQIEAGGFSPYALWLLTDTSYSLSGTTPNRYGYIALDEGEFPWIKIEGISLGDSGDDIICTLHKAKVTSIEGYFRGEEFLLVSCQGIGLPDSYGDIVTFELNESTVY